MTSNQCVHSRVRSNDGLSDPPCPWCESDALRAEVERLHKANAELWGTLAELRIRYHAAGRRPEECYEMSLIDATLHGIVRGAAAVAPKERTHHKLDTDKQVFFYEQDFYVLSNFSAFSLKWCGLRFDTSEAAYHWEKFTAHPQIQQYIFCARSAHEAFKLAETYKHLRRSDWDRVKVEVMRDILRAKVEQHEYVHRKLLETGDRELIEDSWRDDFWGWGPNRDGQNMLGKLWMEVRAELRAATETPAERKP